MDDLPPSAASRRQVACDLAAAGPARHQGLDALRGVLVAAVVIGHFPVSARGHNPFGSLPDWLYFFHIPLFLALSCLFIKPFTPGRMGRRAVPVLVPYGAWVVLAQPGRLLRQPWGLLRDAAMGNWAHLQSVLWFLPALFSTNLLTALWRRTEVCRPWRRVAGRTALLVPALAAFILAPVLARWHEAIPFGLDVAVFLLPFILVMDQVWRQHQRLAAAAGRALAPAALAALVLGGLCIQVWEPVKTHSAFARRVDFAQFSVPVTIPGYLGMVLMAAALVLLAGRLRPPRWLAAVGRRSMPVYLLHYPLLFALRRTLGLAGESPASLLVFGLGLLALVIALATGIAQALIRISPRFAWIGLGTAGSRS